MNKYFVLTFGEYSDKTIAGVYSSREIAESFCFFENHKIEEFVLDKQPAGIPKRYSGKKCFSVAMSRTGDCEVEIADYSLYPYFCDTAFRDGDESEVGLRMMVFADDEKHAAKIANERRAQILAANAWGNGKYVQLKYGRGVE
jgi:hypothetical protein